MVGSKALKKLSRTIGVLFVIAIGTSTLCAHPGHDHGVPSGDWPTHHPEESVGAGVAGSGDFVVAAAAAKVPVAATVWKLSDGTMGSSTASHVNANIQDALADVNAVAYDDEYVYIRTSGIPSHAIGPFGDRNPNTPGDQDATYRVSLNPMEASRYEATGLANVGVATNGVGIFNWSDAHAWEASSNSIEMLNRGQYRDWNTIALVFRLNGLDDGGGHPAGGGPGGSSDDALYHYHQSPYSLAEQLDPDNNGDRHSPIIGYAFDGFPIYGQYAYANGVDDSAGFRQMTSSYQLRDGRPADGPSATEYELGSFAEDYVYVEGAGTLNEFNMAFVNTPEYPGGTWAYFTTFDEEGTGSGLDGDLAFPYTVGPSFFGEVDDLVLGRNPVINVPNDVVFEFVYSAIGISGDCNGDGVVDADDLSCACGGGVLDEVLAETGLLRGDLDGDGEVAFNDFLALAESFGLEGADYSSGDVDCDNDVDFIDFLHLAGNFGKSSAAAVAVPEPAFNALPVMAFALVTYGMFVRRRAFKRSHNV